MKTKKLFVLNKGTLQANGLYNVISKDGKEISPWFDNETAKELRKLNALDFNKRCQELVKNNCKIQLINYNK